MVVRFQELEFMASSLLIELLRLDFDVGFCVTAEMSFQRLMAALVSTADLRLAGSPIRDEVRSLAVELSACEEKRNTIVHSMFIVAEEELKRVKVTAKQKSGLRKVIHETSVQEVEFHIDCVDNAKRSLMAIVKKLQEQGVVSHAVFFPKRRDV